MQIRKYALTLLAFCAALFSFGQSAFKKNDVYLEGAGSGLFGSVNYERQLTKRPGLGIRVGVGFYTENDFYLTIPAGINYLFPLKKNNTFIDAGLSATWARLDAGMFRNSGKPDEEHFVSFVPTIGYRKHTAKEVMWRLSIAPIINQYGVVPWLGFSIGKRF